MIPSPIEHYHHMADEARKRLAWVQNACQTVANAELKALSLKYPNRKLALLFGHGDVSLVIYDRAGKARWTYTPDGNVYDPLPEYIPTPMPELWEVFHDYADNFGDGYAPPLKDVIYQAGKEVRA